MKKIIYILLLFVCITSQQVFSQNLVTDTKSEVIQYMKTKKPHLVPSWDRTSKSNIDYVSFKVDDSHYLLYYFDDDGYCNLYIAIYPYSEMNGIVEKLNGMYTIYKNDIWMDYGEVFDFKWWITREDGFFAVHCNLDKMH